MKNAWDSGFLRAASISWLPLERVPNEDGGWQDTRSELLEWSIVSVPADPDALRESHRLMLDSLLTEAVEEEQEVYLLARSDYEDLKTALGLLRLAVRGVRPEEAAAPGGRAGRGGGGRRPGGDTGRGRSDPERGKGDGRLGGRRKGPSGDVMRLEL